MGAAAILLEVSSVETQKGSGEGLFGSAEREEVGSKGFVIFSCAGPVRRVCAITRLVRLSFRVRERVAEEL